MGRTGKTAIQTSTEGSTGKTEIQPVVEVGRTGKTRVQTAVRVVGTEIVGSGTAGKGVVPEEEVGGSDKTKIHVPVIPRVGLVRI